MHRSWSTERSTQRNCLFEPIKPIVITECFFEAEEVRQIAVYVDTKTVPCTNAWKFPVLQKRNFCFPFFLISWEHYKLIIQFTYKNSDYRIELVQAVNGAPPKRSPAIVHVQLWPKPWSKRQSWHSGEVCSLKQVVSFLSLAASTIKSFKLFV